MALSLWGRPLSFDRAASNHSAIAVYGKRLPFNSFYAQPGADGTDMFLQLHSWPWHVNYVHPPAPTLGRLVTFLPSTKARSIVVFPLPAPKAWWSYAAQPTSDGVVATTEVGGFRIIAYDFTK